MKMRPCCLTPASPDRARLLVPALCMLRQSDPKLNDILLFCGFKTMAVRLTRLFQTALRHFCHLNTFTVIYWYSRMTARLLFPMRHNLPCPLSERLEILHNFRLEFQHFRQLRVVTKRSFNMKTAVWWLWAKGSSGGVWVLSLIFSCPAFTAYSL